METIEKINVRGAINALEVGGAPLELPKSVYILSSVRATASSVVADTGKAFTVDGTDKDKIVVTRID